MRPTILLTDVDGVLLDFTGVCDRTLRSDYYGNITIIEDQYSFAKRYPGHYVSPSAFIDDPRIFSNISPVPGAVDAVRQLKSRGVEIHAITSCLTDSRSMIYRDRNLERVFGPGVFDSVAYIPMGGSKKTALAHWSGQPAVWVDDLPEMIHEGLDMGYFSVMSGHPYNHGVTPTGAVRVDHRRLWSYIPSLFE